MSPKLPVVSGDDFIRILKKFGYGAVRQKGSHVRLRHLTDPQRKPVTVLLVHRLLRDAQITQQQLADSL